MSLRFTLYVKILPLNQLEMRHVSPVNGDMGRQV